NLLGDGTNTTRRLPVRALGRTLYLAGGYINVALRNRTPVLPVFALEDRRHGIRLIIEAPHDFCSFLIAA
ncbi:MAG: hypothetical protein K6T85_17230, partial [Gorillibacterium sp.]|nr:hypothetical protein [Gorillibacterium sp.]